MGQRFFCFDSLIPPSPPAVGPAPRSDPPVVSGPLALAGISVLLPLSAAGIPVLGAGTVTVEAASLEPFNACEIFVEASVTAC